MLKVQKFLDSRPLDDLKNDPFNLIVSAKDNRVLLKYNQFDSDFSNEIVKECRGLILERDTWNVVCHPFHKFFNLGEPNAYPINFEESIVFEKVDGSIIRSYYYEDKWHVATNGTIDAGDAFNKDGISFKDLFFDIISEDNFNELTEKFDKENTYIFELVHPATQIVVDYGNTKEFVFTGMIKNETGDKGELFDYNILSIRKKMEKLFKNVSIRYPKVYNLFDVDDITELIDVADQINFEGNIFEGFVVAQIHNDLVVGRDKIKSPKYVNIHHVATGESVTNNLIDVLIKNEIEEFEVYLAKLPKAVADEYRTLKKRYFKLVEYLSDEGEKYRIKSDTVTRKELALDIFESVNKSCTGFIFKMVDNPEATPTDLLQVLGIKKVKSLLT